MSRRAAVHGTRTLICLCHPPVSSRSTPLSGMQPCIPALAAEAATAPSKVIHVNIGWTTEAPEAPEMETALLST